MKKRKLVKRLDRLNRQFARISIENSCMSTNLRAAASVSVNLQRQLDTANRELQKGLENQIIWSDRFFELAKLTGCYNTNDAGSCLAVAMEQQEAVKATGATCVNDLTHRYRSACERAKLPIDQAVDTLWIEGDSWTMDELKALIRVCRNNNIESADDLDELLDTVL